jgi:AcrR family transcriptional regulator
MRTIAKKANVTTSNIYNYFKNKDEIFETILRPLINKLELAKQLFIEFEIEEGTDHDLVEHQKMTEVCTKFCNENRDELNLLFFKSKGSSYEDYVEDFTDWFTENLKLSFYQHGKEKIDEFIVHVTASIWINSIREILMHNICGDRSVKVAEDIMTFVYLGWKGLMAAHGIEMKK